MKDYTTEGLPPLSILLLQCTHAVLIQDKRMQILNKLSCSYLSHHGPPAFSHKVYDLHQTKLILSVLQICMYYIFRRIICYSAQFNGINVHSLQTQFY